MTSEHTETEVAGLKVMVIDDSKTIRRTAESLLKKAGCEVLRQQMGLKRLPLSPTAIPI